MFVVELLLCAFVAFVVVVGDDPYSFNCFEPRYSQACNLFMNFTTTFNGRVIEDGSVLYHGSMVLYTRTRRTPISNITTIILQRPDLSHAYGKSRQAVLQYTEVNGVIVKEDCSDGHTPLNMRPEKECYLNKNCTGQGLCEYFNTTTCTTVVDEDNAIMRRTLYNLTTEFNYSRPETGREAFVMDDSFSCQSVFSLAPTASAYSKMCFPIRDILDGEVELVEDLED